MAVKLYIRIRDIIENTPGLTQKGLAKAMGINAAAVNRMLHGQRNIMAEEIPVIERYLGVKLDISDEEHVSSNNSAGGVYDFAQGLHSKNAAAKRSRGFSDVPSPTLQIMPVAFQDHTKVLMPVYPLFAIGERAVDWVLRHPLLVAIDDAFAIYVASDDMEPRYFRGELVYLHPGRPPEDNRDCLVVLNSGEATLRRLTAQSASDVTLEHYHAHDNKPLQTVIARSDIKIIYAVVGRG